MDHARVLGVALVSSPRVGVAMYPGMARELVGARELLAAAGELAGMRLLAGMGADVPGLVLEPMEGLVAQRALVRTRQLVDRLGRRSSWKWPVRADHSDGGHVFVCLSWRVAIPLYHNLRIQQVGKIHR